MKILVTGGSGFVGKNLTEALVQAGHSVTIVSTGAEPQIKGVDDVLYMGLDGIDWNCVANQDVVFHQMANNDTRCQSIREMFAANVTGPIKLFNIAYNGGCRNFVYASSTAVYGNSPAPYIEDITELKPLTVYGESKRAFDQFAMHFAEEKKVNITGLRYCNIYGPGEGHKGKRMSMIGQVARNMMNLIRPKLFKDGEQKRDWCYVADIVQANLLAMNRSKGSYGEIYNIGSGAASTFNKIIELLNQKFKLFDHHYDLSTEYIDCPFQSEYQDFTLCCIEKAKRDLGYLPAYDLEQGIHAYVCHLVNCMD